MEGSHFLNLGHVALTTPILGVSLLCVGYNMLHSMCSQNRKFLTLTKILNLDHMTVTTPTLGVNLSCFG